MIPIYNKFNYSAYVCLLLFFACDRNSSFVDEKSDYKQQIGFKIDGVTRAAFSEFPVGAELGVLGYSCTDGTFYDDASAPDLIYNARLINLPPPAGYQYTPVANWPQLGKAKFFAYYPHSKSIQDGAISISPITMVGPPEVTLELGIEKSRVDFAVAEVGPVTRLSSGDPIGTPARDNNFVNFEFKRKLAYVSFAAKAVNMASYTRLFIDKVVIKNVHTRAIYKFKDDKWYPDVDVVSGATLNLTSIGSQISEVDFKDIVDPGGNNISLTLFPQTYDNVVLDITYTIEYIKPEGGSEYRITGLKRVPISVDWKAGISYVCKLEFAFIEAFEGGADFALTVKNWTTVWVDTEM